MVTKIDINYDTKLHLYLILYKIDFYDKNICKNTKIEYFFNRTLKAFDKVNNIIKFRQPTEKIKMPKIIYNNKILFNGYQNEKLKHNDIQWKENWNNDETEFINIITNIIKKQDKKIIRQIARGK